MINHARTLLLNANFPTDPAPWERYIPEEFTPLILKQDMEIVRSVLVGTGGWWDQTFNVEQLLTTIQSPRFVRDYLWMDKRTTEPQTDPFSYAYVDSAIPNVENDTAFAGFVRQPSNRRVPIKREWHVFAVSGTTMRVTYNGNHVSKDLANGGLLLDEDLLMVFNAPVPAGWSWRVTSYRKPDNMMVTYPVALGHIGSATVRELFMKKYPGDEVLDTYSGWVKSDQVEQVVAGYTLAYLWKATYLL